MPSLIYTAVEQGAYLLDKLSNGEFRRKALGIEPGDSSRAEPSTPPLSMRHRFATRTVMLDGHPCYIVRSRELGAQTPSRAILFLHGGGGMSAPTMLHFTFASRLVEKTGAELWFARYPLAPPTNVVDALVWLEKLHARMLESVDASSIAFVGDSAGANLALQLCSRLKERRGPYKVVAISPASGLDSSVWIEERKKIAPLDPILPLEICDLVAEHWGRGVNISGPDIEPLAVNYADFPPTMITYGTHELFACAIPQLEKRMREAGVELTLVCGEGLCHDYPLAWVFPEALEASQSIADFLCN